MSEAKSGLTNQQSADVKGVNFLDLSAQHAPLRAELDRIWDNVATNSLFVGGTLVSDFEAAWAAYSETEYCIGLANGTDSLELTLAELSVGPGDEVIVPTNTFVATPEAVVAVGATPVFVDVDPDTLLVTAETIEAGLTEKTKAVMVVHLYGAIPTMAPIVELCEKNNLHLIEDAAQAHGARHGGLHPGAFGVAASFSFYPGKNLGAFGDAGAVSTNDKDLAERIRIRANHGRGDHLHHIVSGCNSRLDAFQAAVLQLKLAHLDGWNERRRQVHGQYMELFQGHELVKTLSVPENTEAVHHLEVIRVPDRDAMRTQLAKHNIGTGLHYSHPCHEQPAFSQYARSALPVAEQACAHQLSLPMHPMMSRAEVEYVVHHVVENLEAN